MSIDFGFLAKKYGTPLYIYDFNEISDNYRALKEAFAGQKSLISYAVKANSNLSVVSHLHGLGAGADCVSIGEVKRALLAGIEKYKIVFSGVGKKDEEIREALNEDILLLNLESQEEMKRVEMIARDLGVVARISIRVNPNVDAKTHPYISTGLHDNKFGVDIDMAKRMYIYANNSENLDPIGVHFHIGSQLLDLSPIKEAADIIADLVRSLKAIGVDIKFFDVGGGVGVRYRQDETPIDMQEYADAVKDAIKGMDVTIMCEPGRSIVANAGYLLSSVLYEKVNGAKRFVIVDAGMNDMMRPALYDVYHELEYLGDSKEDISAAEIVGPVCESSDWFGKNVMLPKTKHNDLILMHGAGAYGFTMSSNYNTRSRAAEIAIEDGKDRIIRDRESFEDIVRLEQKYMQK